MPSAGGRTVVRSRKPTKSKGKAQPTSADTSAVESMPHMQSSSEITLKAKEPALRGTHVQLIQQAERTKLSAKDQHGNITDESIEIIQTFLFSAISTILWMRDLLPSDYFRTMYYTSINNHCSYHDFTHGDGDQTLPHGERPQQKGYHLYILKRNASVRGDLIIKWLETGVFEAIKRGYLSQLQFSIFADPKQPTEVLELYCFHFQYAESLTDGGISVDVEVKDAKNKKTISLQNAREALNTIVRNMVTLNGSMPCLPERCCMSPYLIWNARRPSGYQPLGFSPSADENISFPVTEGWAMEISTCGQVKTGLQIVELGVVYTKETAAMATDGGEAVVMPEFEYGEEFSRLEPFGTKDDAPKAQQDIPGNGVQVQGTSINQITAVMGKEAVASISKSQEQRQQETVETGEPDRTGTETGVGTQDKEDLIRLRALRPVEPRQAQDTQLIPRPPSPLFRLKFSTETIQVLHKKRESREAARTRTSPRRRSPGPVMSCECGTKEQDNVIQCHFCNSSQHAQCYGYEGPGDVRIPVEHACYTCLLDNNDGKHLAEVVNLARTRQVIHSLREQSLETPTRIAQALGYTRVEIMDLLQELQHDNIVLLMKTKKSKAGQHVKLSLSEVSEQVLKQTYLNPTSKIEDLVERAYVTEQAVVNTAGRKRKDVTLPDDGRQPKTPRISRPIPHLAFDSNAIYTPDHDNYLRANS